MLKTLRLTNFKSFQRAEMDLGALTLVVGTNASGKSNLRDALRFLHGVGLGYSLADILGEKYGAGGVLQWRGIRGGVREVAFDGSPEFEVGCQFRMPSKGRKGAVVSPPYSLRVNVADERTGPRVVKEGLGTDGWYPFYWDSHPREDPPIQKGEHQIRVRHPRGGNYRSHGKVSEYSSARPVLSQFAEREREPASARRACTSLLDALKGMRFLDLDPDAIRQPSQPGQAVLGDRGENLSSVLQAICEDADRKAILLSWLRSLTPMDAVDFDFKTDFTGRVLVHLVESSGRTISALSASDGTLRFLALVAALLSPDTGRIYFFEEFDNGIHPTRLHLLLQLVQQMCREQGIQVIGTTHNPAMLAFLEAEALDSALLVYRPDHAPDSRIRRIMDLPDIERILKTNDLGHLHSTGWLEDAAVFSEPDLGQPQQIVAQA